MKRKLLFALCLSNALFATAQTYSSTGSVAINDGPGSCGVFSTAASSLINVPLTGTIGTPSEVTINVGIDHTFAGDIDIEIVAPDGTSCFLINHIGAATCSGASDNFVSGNVLSFNSAFVTSIPTTGVSSTNIPAGNYAPTGSTAYPSVCNLATFLSGKSVNGNWALRGRDHFSSQIGSITAWSIEFGATALPLELLSFSVNPNKGYNLLQWETGVEKDMSHIEIERSVSGNTFTKVAKVQTMGSYSAYQFSDELSDENMVLYRLKMVNKDGTSNYSKTVKLFASNATVGSNSLSISPNPTKGFLTISVTDKDIVGTDATVINQMGKTVHTFKVESARQNIDFSQLAFGVYSIRLNNGAVLRFVKED